MITLHYTPLSAIVPNDPVKRASETLNGQSAYLSKECVQ